jgi:hypothetical protein
MLAIRSHLLTLPQYQICFANLKPGLNGVGEAFPPRGDSYPNPGFLLGLTMCTQYGTL